MATKYIRIGSAENVFSYNDDDYTTSADFQGPVTVGTAPTASDQVLRLGDTGAAGAITGTIGVGSGIVVGNLVYINGSSKWVKADAADLAKFSLGVVTEMVDAATARIMLGAGYAQVKVLTPGISIMSPLYLSETLGFAQVNPPALPSVIQRVGVAMAVPIADLVYARVLCEEPVSLGSA